MTANEAVTRLAAVMVTEYVPVPVHGPDQPANREPAAALAVSFTSEPAVYACEHTLPQLIPPGELVTSPAPLLSTVSVYVRGATAKDCWTCGATLKSVSRLARRRSRTCRPR